MANSRVKGVENTPPDAERAVSLATSDTTAETALPQDAAIAIRGLIKRFGDRTILKGIDLDIIRGKTTVIMGGSGSGKSTLLKHLIGLLKPDEGAVYYDGVNIANHNEDQMNELRLRLGMLFQGAALLNSLTVGENVALPLREHSNLPDEVISTVVKMKLQMVGLRGFEDLRPSEISGGMKKRVGLARAIVLDPQIVFYDEPSAGLDPIVSAVVDQLIMDLTRKMQITSVVVTHDMTSAFRIAHYMVMIYQGKVVAYGTPDEIRNNPEPIVQQFIHGKPEGVIPLEQSKEAFIQDILRM